MDNKIAKIISIILVFAIPFIANGATLMDIYEDALINDPRLKEAYANKEAIIESKPQARSSLLPQISASGTYSDTNTDGSSTFQQKIVDPISGDFVVITNTTQFDQEADGLQWDITLRQNIIDPGAWMMLKKANKIVAQAEADYLAAEQDLMLRVCSAYFDGISTSR